jgi:hypothetical protein
LTLDQKTLQNPSLKVPLKRKSRFLENFRVDWIRMKDYWNLSHNLRVKTSGYLIGSKEGIRLTPKTMA